MKTLPDLSGFTGSETFYRHQLARRVLHTDGVNHLAEKAGAFWLVDEIAFAQRYAAVGNESFQVWKLKVEGSSAELVVEDGNDNVVRSKRIEFTDFPAPGITLYAARNELGGVTIMIPSEY